MPSSHETRSFDAASNRPPRPNILSCHTRTTWPWAPKGDGRWGQTGPGPWADVRLSDEEAMQIIAVLADVLDGHDVRDAVSAAWSLLASAWAQAGVADPDPKRSFHNVRGRLG